MKRCVGGNRSRKQPCCSWMAIEWMGAVTLELEDRLSRGTLLAGKLWWVKLKQMVGCLWWVTPNQHSDSNGHCLSHTIFVAIMARQKCSPTPCYADNNGHIPVCEWRPVSVKRLLDDIREKHEKPFQLGFTFMWLCQLRVILCIVPSTGWNTSQKGRIAYLLQQTIWMWESACSIVVHADHFTSILHW